MMQSAMKLDPNPLDLIDRCITKERFKAVCRWVGFWVSECVPALKRVLIYAKKGAS